MEKKDFQMESDVKVTSMAKQANKVGFMIVKIVMQGF